MDKLGGRISVFTANEYLFKKIMLDAPEDYEVLLCSSESVREADLYLWDADTVLSCPVPALKMSRTQECDIKIPFPLGRISSLVKRSSSLLKLSIGERCAFLYGEQIKLTEVEFALISLLYEKGGEYASREEVLDAVWHGEADSGVINVYVHYLREKLETRGEKIILSSRKNGYCIDKKFIGGYENA